jgi:Tfp pilus assembly protein PilN
VRPVDLTPPEERRRGRTPARGGGLAHLLVAVLALALVAITALVLTQNQISAREAEVVRLEQENAEAQARLEKLRPFANFASLEQRRLLTLTSLATSRFDWERVMRELARVIPEDVWLVNLTGSVSPAVNIDDGAGITIRTEVAGPALELIGCARSQDSVAGFISVLGDIDGVTRVSAARSERPANRTDSGTNAGAVSGDECRTRNFIARFELVAAFDAAATVAISTPPAPPGPSTAPGGESGGAPASESAPRQAGAAANEPTQGNEASGVASLGPGA